MKYATFTLAFAVFIGAAANAADNKLTIHQIYGEQEANSVQVGRSNRAMVTQGAKPKVSAVGRRLNLDTTKQHFDFLDPLPAMTARNGPLLGSENGFTGQEGLSIEGILDALPRSPGGHANMATVRQIGTRNRVLGVQLGSHNVLETTQDGSNNLGVHIQTGDANNTRLVQDNADNTNALIARGRVTGPDGGSFTMRAEGNVKGLSVDLQGTQNFRRITAGRNATGGYNIDFRK
jgi:hypothetical protein